MKKTILIMLLLIIGLIGFMGVANAADLQVLGVYTSNSFPPALNTNTLLRTDVYVNSTSPVSTTLRTDFGNGNIANKDYTLNPGISNIWSQVTYTAVGTYTVTSTIDPLNNIAEDNETNNVGSTIVVIASNGTTNPPQINGTSFQVSGTSFGSSSQERDQTATSTLHITNDGTQSVVLTLTSNIGSNYQLNFGQNNVNLAAGTSVDIPVSIYIPTSQDSGTATLGYINVNGGGLSRVSTVSLSTKSELEFSRIRLNVAGDSKSLSNGGSVNAKPGDDVTLSVTTRNDYSSSVDMRNNILTVSSSGDIDLNENNDLNDLSYGETDSQDFSFTIPTDASDNQDIDIKVTGIDRNGAHHSASAHININVKKESHDIKIIDFTVTPQTVQCGGKVTASAKIENDGRNDENAVSLVIKNDDMNIFNRFRDISIYTSDSYSKSYTFTVPASTPPGQYFVEATTYYDTDVQSNDYMAQLTVTCGNNPNNNGNNNYNNGNNNYQYNNTNNNANNNANNNVPPQVVFPQGTTGPSYGSASFFNTSSYVIVLIAAVVVFLVLIIILLVKFVF